MSKICKKTILVVDDDARMVRALEKVLQDEGATVIAAFDAAEAVEILTRRQNKVDLVITDLRMPFVNGMTLLYAIHEILPTLPVIVLTAFGSPYVRAECFREGAAEFLEKPLDSDHLLRKVARVLSEDIGADKNESKKITAEGRPDAKKVGIFQSKKE